MVTAAAGINVPFHTFESVVLFHRTSAVDAEHHVVAADVPKKIT